MPTLIADACLLITLGNANALWLLRDIPGWRVVTCPRAVAEVCRPPSNRELAAALEEGWIQLVAIEIESDRERLALVKYDAMSAFRNRGDAEILALAEVRGYTVGSDDRRVRSEAAGLGADRLAGCVDLLVLAVRAGAVQQNEAQALLDRFDVAPDIELSDLI